MTARLISQIYVILQQVSNTSIVYIAFKDSRYSRMTSMGRWVVPIGIISIGLPW